MSISMFDTRTMLAALEQMPRPRTFLRDTFFNNLILSETAAVDVDIVKGKRRVAVYVSPTAEGHVVDRIGYSTNTYAPPYIKEKMATTAVDILKRSAGETIYAAQSPAARAAAQLRKDMMELDDLITRAEEIQACEAMFSGAVTVRDGTTISFGLAAAHNLASNAGHTLWGSIAKNALLTQLKGWRKLLIKDSGRAPTDLILGTDAADKLIAVLDPDSGGASLSSIRVDRGNIDPRLLPNGVTYWGFLKEIGVDVWSYDEWYHNGSTDVEMVPAKKMWMGSRNARFDKLYGAILDMSALYAAERFPKSWETEDPSARWLMLQAAPLLVPHEVDSYLVAQVLS